MDSAKLSIIKFSKVKYSYDSISGAILFTVSWDPSHTL